MLNSYFWAPGGILQRFTDGLVFLMHTCAPASATILIWVCILDVWARSQITGFLVCLSSAPSRRHTCGKNNSFQFSGYLLGVCHVLSPWKFHNKWYLTILLAPQNQHVLKSNWESCAFQPSCQNPRFLPSPSQLLKGWTLASYEWLVSFPPHSLPSGRQLYDSTRGIFSGLYSFLL